MYESNDNEILMAYDSYLEDMPDKAESISGATIWIEAFKRGMRFNPNLQPKDSADSICPCDLLDESGCPPLRHCQALQDDR